MTPTILGPIATLTATIIAVVVADGLTVTGRLRRKLEREVTILDKLPDGLTKNWLGKIVRRHTLELVWRERLGYLTRRAIRLLLVSLTSIGVALYAILFPLRGSTGPFNLRTQPVVIAAAAAASVALSLALGFLAGARKARKEYLDKFDRDPTQELIVPGPLRHTRTGVPPPPAPDRLPWWSRTLAAPRLWASGTYRRLRRQQR